MATPPPASIDSAGDKEAWRMFEAMLGAVSRCPAVPILKGTAYLALEAEALIGEPLAVAHHAD
jgi:hypothetical protein